MNEDAVLLAKALDSNYWLIVSKWLSLNDNAMYEQDMHRFERLEKKFTNEHGKHYSYYLSNKQVLDK